MEDFSVKLTLDDDLSASKRHFHEHYELLLAIEGSSDVFVDKQLLQVRPGTLLKIPPATLHHNIAKHADHSSSYIVHVSPTYMSRISTPQTDLTKCFASPLFVQLDEVSVKGLSKLLDTCIYEDSRFGEDLRKQNALIEFLLQAGELSQTSPTPKVEITRTFERVTPILQYIDDNISGDLSLSALSQAFFVSRQHLCRIFKAETGFSVKEYVSRVRILHACSLLRSGCSVQRAGEASGFSNNTHFIRMFGQIMGISPGKYAREFRNVQRA